jgi:hypothetical protein
MKATGVSPTRPIASGADGEPYGVSSTSSSTSSRNE